LNCFAALIFGVFLGGFAQAGQAQTPIRVAFFHTELTQKGPGLALRELIRGESVKTQSVLEVITETQPDILVLQGIDWDGEQVLLRTLADRLADLGTPLPYQFSRPPNRAVPTGFDLNENGILDEPEDAQSYGRFTGQEGLAVLSRFPLTLQQDFTDMLWAQQSGVQIPWPGMAEHWLGILRLSTTNHYTLQVAAPDRFLLGVYAAGSPVFDGPEDRNGRRNHDETMFWVSALNGQGPARIETPFVLAGNANLDPERGEGRREAIQTLLNHPQLQDPLPGQVTVDWLRADLPPMRTSYVLPGRAWDVLNAGVVTPKRLPAAKIASRHWLVWVDITPRAPP
jgi:hypothetical protein